MSDNDYDGADNNDDIVHYHDYPDDNLVYNYNYRADHDHDGGHYHNDIAHYHYYRGDDHHQYGPSHNIHNRGPLDDYLYGFTDYDEHSPDDYDHRSDDNDDTITPEDGPGSRCLACGGVDATGTRWCDDCRHEEHAI